jgi:hypothetical protein
VTDEEVKAALDDLWPRSLAHASGSESQAGSLVFCLGAAKSMLAGISEQMLVDEVYRIARDLERQKLETLLNPKRR